MDCVNRTKDIIDANIDVLNNVFDIVYLITEKMLTWT